MSIHIDAEWLGYIWWFIPAIPAAVLTDWLIRRRPPGLQLIPEEDPPFGFGPMTVRRISVRNRTSWLLRFFLPGNSNLRCKASLRVYDLEKNLVCKLKGRWAADRQHGAPDTPRTSEAPNEPDVALIPYGKEKVLNCAVHPYFEDAGVFISTRSIRFDRDWRKFSFRVPEGRYIVEVLMESQYGGRCIRDFLLSAGSHASKTRLELLEKPSTNYLLDRYHWPGVGLP